MSSRSFRDGKVLHTSLALGSWDCKVLTSPALGRWDGKVLFISRSLGRWDGKVLLISLALASGSLQVMLREMQCLCVRGVAV